MCTLLGVTVFESLYMYDYCKQDCVPYLLTIRPHDKEVVGYIREMMVDPPFPRGSCQIPNQTIVSPDWRDINAYEEAHKVLLDIFKDYPLQGTFVEVGAQDGEFFSFTLYLEQVLGFRGLLVEPHPHLYAQMRRRKRSSHSVRACASPTGVPYKDILWARTVPEDLPPIPRRIQEGSNRLLRFVPASDHDLGTLFPVQCLGITALTLAVFGVPAVDLLVISTVGGVMETVASLPRIYSYKVLVLVNKATSVTENDAMKEIEETKRMAMVYSIENIHIFISLDPIIV
ncbi:uncharacterized protein LOC143035093 [Oratosquilla oratoria]|uniref:uncharacterized protein LOC143035093 n=1 Tax=Oratosquilla oratoria TaxID=337810 RepID=UPI003F773ACB